MSCSQSTHVPSNRQVLQDKVTITRQDYRRLIERLRDSGNFFQFSRDFLYLMPESEAVALQHLMNVGNGVRASGGDGWFRCTVEEINGSFKGRMSARVQEKVFKRLIKRGYIRTKRVGIPPCRHVWIDVIRIEEELATAIERAKVGRNQSPPNGGIASPPNGGDWIPPNGGDQVKKIKAEKDKEKKERAEPDSLRSSARNAPVVKAANRNTSDPRHQAPAGALFGKVEATAETWDARCARILHGAIVAYYLPTKALNVKTQATYIRLLATKDGFDPAHIEAVMVWYCAEKRSAPEVICAKQFRSTFTWINGLMTKAKPQTEDPVVPITDKDTLFIAEKIGCAGWPKGSGADLPREIQHSLPPIRALYKRVSDIQDNLDLVPGITASERIDFANFCDAVLQFHMGSDPVSACISWYRRVWGRVKNWREWSGELACYRFSVGCKQFAKIVTGESLRYSNAKRYGDLLLAALAAPQ